jgi:hypothetical protein
MFRGASTTKQELKVDQLTDASCFAGVLQETSHHLMVTGTPQHMHADLTEW